MPEIIGKVGSKGELYPPKRIRNELGFSPDTVIEFIISPNGDLIVRKIDTIEDILNQPSIATIDLEDFETMSEEMQKKGEQ